MVLTATLPQDDFSRPGKLAIDKAVDVGSGPGSITIDEMMANLRAEGIDLPFDIETFGIWGPDVADNRGEIPNMQLLDDGKITPAEWDDYIDWLRNHDDDQNPGNQLSDQHDGYKYVVQNHSPVPADHPSYGEPVTQKFERYSESVYNECGLSNSYDAYRCYQTFSRQSAIAKDDEAALRKKYENAKWKLNFDGRMDWSESETVAGTKAKYRDAIDQYEKCVGPAQSGDGIESIAERTDACHTAFDNGDYGQLCSLCELPTDHECSPSTLRQKFDTLPPALE